MYLLYFNQKKNLKAVNIKMKRNLIRQTVYQ